MVDVRRIVIIFMIAVLYTIFVHSLIDAVMPHPEYPNCGRPAPVKFADAPECPTVEWDESAALQCRDDKGEYMATYDSQGCVAAYECSDCMKGYHEERGNHAQIAFYLSALFALIAIVIGLYLPTTNPLNEWVGFGFILGGLFSLFTGTAQFYEHIGRLMRPIVMLVELGIVLFVTYKKIDLKQEPEKAPNKRARKSKK